MVKLRNSLLKSVTNSSWVVCKRLILLSIDSNSKLWNFSVKDYTDFMNKVSSLAPHVVIGPLPAYVLKVIFLIKIL